MSFNNFFNIQDGPHVTVDICQSMMFANITNFKDISEMEGDNCVSLEEKVRKVDYVLIDITDRHFP